VLRLFKLGANGAYLSATKHIERKQVAVMPIRFDLLAAE
jgi:hypothetical protein